MSCALCTPLKGLSPVMFATGTRSHYESKNSDAREARVEGLWAQIIAIILYTTSSIHSYNIGTDLVEHADTHAGSDW